MQRLRLLTAGGSLSAGKATKLTRLARHDMGRGQRVGLVGDDQAGDGHQGIPTVGITGVNPSSLNTSALR